MLTYSGRHGFVGTNAFQRDDSSEEDSSSEQDYSLNRESYTGLCFGCLVRCLVLTSMDVRIVEEDMTFYRAQEGSTCSGYDLDVFGSRPLWLGSHTNASIYDRNRGEIIALTTSRQLVLFDLGTTNLDALLKFHQDDTGVCDAIRKAMGYQKTIEPSSRFHRHNALYTETLFTTLWRDTPCGWHWIESVESYRWHQLNRPSDLQLDTTLLRAIEAMCVSLGVNAHGYHTTSCCTKEWAFQQRSHMACTWRFFWRHTNDVMKDSSLKNQVDIINEANQAGF
jgi:hypothetical protein